MYIFDAKIIIYAQKHNILKCRCVLAQDHKKKFRFFCIVCGCTKLKKNKTMAMEKYKNDTFHNFSKKKLFLLPEKLAFCFSIFTKNYIKPFALKNCKKLTSVDF